MSNTNLGTAMHDTAMYELSPNQTNTVSGGLLSVGLKVEGQSALDVATLWKNGVIAEQVTNYQSVSSGSFSIGLDI